MTRSFSCDRDCASQDSSLCLSPQPGSWSADLLDTEQDMGILIVKASVSHGFQRSEGWNVVP